MALGDSITAGAFIRGIQNDPEISVSEWRGQSYAAGMDDGAVTIPNVRSFFTLEYACFAEYFIPVY